MCGTMSVESEMEATPLTAEQEADLLAVAVERAPKELAKLSAAVDEESAFYALPDAALAAFRIDRFEESEAFAKQALALAPSYKANWNYGNAIHFARTALGLLALRRGDIPAAVAELAESGATRGSPQLNSFGPSMELAKQLLCAGEFQAVQKYLMQCRLFWEMGTAWLDIWEMKVRAHQIPNFFMHSHR
jgi:tetratricopeptide (TPR) repeat protein